MTFFLDFIFKFQDFSWTFIKTSEFQDFSRPGIVHFKFQDFSRTCGNPGSDETPLKEKLYGDLAALKRTAAIMQATGVDI